MESIQTAGAAVHFGERCWVALRQHLEEQDYSSCFVLVDTNTETHCLQAFLKEIGDDFKFHLLRIAAGEENKNLSSCEAVWKQLSEQGADRHSLLLNLGGGVVCDLGGFAAATFKRGISFINLPTTLLSMVDASVGGKTGVDLGNLKNQVGLIREPELVLVWPPFLSTLPERERYSGFAEMLKHGLIADPSYWNKLKALDKLDRIADHIAASVRIKSEVVRQDPNENGLRKILNFGHTLGHAIESHFLQANHLPTLLHGEAIAVGMVLEAYLSQHVEGLPKEALEDIRNTFRKFFKVVDIPEDELQQILDLMVYDKKNRDGNINFVLLKAIGNPQTDRTVTADLIREAMAYYKEM